MTVLAPRPVPNERYPSELCPGPRPLPRAEPLTRLPILVLLIHERCDCRCRMCDIWKRPGRREVAVESVVGWLPEWRQLGVERVVLSGGEPLLHSRLAELGGVLREAGLGVTLISTGLQLPRHAASVASFCDDVVVSLDGPPEVHAEIRNVPRAFQRLGEGVTALRATGAALRITGRCTVQRANCRALSSTAAAARDLGLDGISFLAADVSSEAFNRPGGWDDERAGQVALNPEDLEALDRELERLETVCAEDFATGFISESPAKLRRRLYDYFSALLGQGEFPEVRCNAPWVSSVIEVDGTVKPCFFHAAQGNLHQAGSLGTVVNAAGPAAWRRGLDLRRDETCRRCVCSLELRSAAAEAGN